jgi:hypothetical protein
MKELRSQTMYVRNHLAQLMAERGSGAAPLTEKIESFARLYIALRREPAVLQNCEQVFEMTEFSPNVLT